MNLQRAVNAFGTDDFTSVLRDEIEQRSGDLPLEELMDNGGRLPENAEVSVGDVTADNEQITASIEVFFDEDHPSGCADMTRTDTYRTQFTVRIDRESGDATFECEGADNTSDDGDDEVDVGDMDLDERADCNHRNSEL